MQFELIVPPSFRLDALSAFYSAFEPMRGAVSGEGPALRAVLLQDRSWAPLAVSLSQHGDRLRVAAVGAADEEVLARQIRRMFGLDADADAWVALGRRDERVGELQRQFPGFHTAAFPSPYQAGIHGLLSHRVSMRQAAGLQRSLSEALGARIDGDFAPPSPERLAEAGAVPGLGPEQVERLRALGAAAAEGRLDAERLRSLPQEQAVAELRALPGVGPWTAEHVVLRGAAPPDGLPTAEPRVERAVGDLYGLGDAPGQPAVREVTEPWRPFRMWVSILAVRRLAALGRFSGVSSDRQRRGRRSGAASRQGSSATK